MVSTPWGANVITRSEICFGIDQGGLGLLGGGIAEFAQLAQSSRPSQISRGLDVRAGSSPIELDRQNEAVVKWAVYDLARDIERLLFRKSIVIGGKTAVRWQHNKVGDKPFLSSFVPVFINGVSPSASEQGCPPPHH
jgi:hypothetical protein